MNRSENDLEPLGNQEHKQNMKHLTHLKSNPLAVFVAGLLLFGAFELVLRPLILRADGQPTPPVQASDCDGKRDSLKAITSRLPTQSHEMQDVGYHFENLWFAGDRQNWPLAGYYLRKTRFYLELAVQIKPVHKTRAGTEVDLQGILDAVNHGLLAQVDKAITNKDVAGFKAAYRQTMEGCDACHTACGVPYLKLQIPTAPSAPIINFNPGGIPSRDEKSMVTP